jgi:putative glutamine amidotransferase
MPILEDGQVLPSLETKLDGIILSGGDDVAAPQGEWQVRPECLTRSEHESRLIEAAAKHKIPLLGICRGVQQLNVFFGGTLWEDLPAWKSGAVDHRRGKRNSAFRHAIGIESESWLHTVLGATAAQVNSSHHQAALGVPKALRAVAHAEDGVIEALESTEGLPIWGVQWHPERMGENPAGEGLLRWFVSICSEKTR